MQLSVTCLEKLVTVKRSRGELFIHVCTTPGKVLCDLQSLLLVIVNFNERMLFLHIDVYKGI